MSVNKLSLEPETIVSGSFVFRGDKAIETQSVLSNIKKYPYTIELVLYIFYAASRNNKQLGDDMKWLGGVCCVVVLGFGLIFSSGKATAGTFGDGYSWYSSSKKVYRPRHKVRMKYKRRFGRKYSRRIAAFVRNGPYVSRRTLKRQYRKKRRYLR